MTYEWLIREVGVAPPRQYPPKTRICCGHGGQKGSLNGLDLPIQGELPRLLNILTKTSPPFILIKKKKGGKMDILWIVNTNTFLLVIVIIMVSYLITQMSALIRWLRRE
jgi:hypothetical protein